MKKRNQINHGKRNAMRIGALVIAGMLTVTTAFAPGFTKVAYADSSVSTDSTTNIPGTVTTQSKFNDSFLSVTGFAGIEGNVNDRSQYVGTEYYRTISNEKEFLDAIVDAQKGLVKVMELTADMNLGWEALTQELGKAPNKAGYNWVSKYPTPSNELAKVNGGFTNPLMQISGVTKISLTNINGLTIFSKNGKCIKHTELKLNSSCSDIVIRNLNFKEMWQWDDKGTQKEVGWSNLKINGGKNIWVDHCSFEMASDGNIDMENGSSGITISWCAIGIDATENPSQDSSLYQSIMFMEDRYQKNELTADTSLYSQMRKGGATPQQIMAYAAYHKKCHLTGSGDKDYVNYVSPDGTVLADANSNLQLTLAYNHYSNCGQRVPMIRQGVGNLINCYVDDTTHFAAEAACPIFSQIGPYHLSRCLNSRNGASIAADTCVFNGIEEPITGSEVQGDDITNMASPWNYLFQNAYNHVLISNSTVTNSKGTYTGSSWDNNGDNLFTTGFNWRDKSTLGKWAWSSSIVNKESYIKDKPPTIADAPFTFTYDSETKLPFSYQVLPLEDVKSVVTENSGAGVLNISDAEWLMTAYLADADYSSVNVAIDKANSLNPADYVDFTAVTNAINAVEKGLKSDKQESVSAMATAIENAINSLVKIAVEDSIQEKTSPKTADKSMVSMYTLFLSLSAGLAGMAATLNKKNRVNK